MIHIWLFFAFVGMLLIFAGIIVCIVFLFMKKWIKARNAGLVVIAGFVLFVFSAISESISEKVATEPTPQVNQDVEKPANDSEVKKEGVGQETLPYKTLGMSPKSLQDILIWLPGNSIYHLQLIT